MTLKNEGSFSWRANPESRDGVIQRGEVALGVHLDGEWIDTYMLPKPEVAPGEQVTVHFPLATSTEAGVYNLTLDLVEWAL